MERGIQIEEKYREKPTTELLDYFGAVNASSGSGSAAALTGLLA